MKINEKIQTKIKSHTTVFFLCCLICGQWLLAWMQFVYLHVTRRCVKGVCYFYVSKIYRTYAIFIRNEKKLIKFHWFWVQCNKLNEIMQLTIFESSTWKSTPRAIHEWNTQGIFNDFKSIENVEFTKCIQTIRTHWDLTNKKKFVQIVVIHQRNWMYDYLCSW